MNVEAYQGRFLELFGYGSKLEEAQLVSCFVQGLANDLKYQVDVRNPRTLAEAARMAMILESGMRKRATTSFPPRHNDRTKRPFVTNYGSKPQHNDNRPRPNGGNQGGWQSNANSQWRVTSLSLEVLRVAKEKKQCVKCLGVNHKYHEC